MSNTQRPSGVRFLIIAFWVCAAAFGVAAVASLIMDATKPVSEE